MNIGCGTTDHYSQWVVVHRAQDSGYSTLRCLVMGCGRGWRTKAQYVDQIPDAVIGPDGELRRP